MIDSAAGVKDKLKALAAAKASGAAFLTVTLSTSRLDDWRLFAPAFLHSEFNRITKESGVSKENKRLLQTDLDHVLDVLMYDVTPATQGLAVFADGAAASTSGSNCPSDWSTVS